MKPLLRESFGRRSRVLRAFACLLAVSMQLALPLLHQAHGDHAAQLRAPDGAAGSIRSDAAHAQHHEAHEPATCPQCRMVSHAGSLLVSTLVVAAPPATASRVVDARESGPRSRFAVQEGPPRAPPLSA